MLIFSVLSRLYYTEPDSYKKPSVSPDASFEQLNRFTTHKKGVVGKVLHVKNLRVNTQEKFKSKNIIDERSFEFNHMRNDDSQSQSEISLHDDTSFRDGTMSRIKSQVLTTLREIIRNRRKYKST